MDALKHELKILIIDTLDLEDIKPEEIIDEAPLFVEGLGLDSIDALEIGVAIQQRYNIKLSAKDENLKAHFHSIQTIASYVQDRLAA